MDAESAMLVVRTFNERDREAWDTFVSNHPYGSPFHLIAWKESIEQTFGYRPFYLLATIGDRVAGVLPLFLAKSLLTGRRLISSPFCGLRRYSGRFRRGPDSVARTRQGSGTPAQGSRH